MKVPFADLRAQYLAHRDAIDGAIQSVIDTTAFIGGKYVTEFEAAYARSYGVEHCISVANGTDAIYIVLRMLGIGPGDEVITTSMSWFSTAETISQTGAVPVFVDVDEHYNIDPRKVEQAITPRTRALLPVHLFGQAARMRELAEIAQKHRLLLIEDCAQAHYATHDGKRVGTIGIAGTFSFYPGKNLGAYGDAGAIVTNDGELAKKLRMYANHGQLKKHDHQLEGLNSRLDGIQAAILSAKLPHIDAWTRARQRLGEQYSVSLTNIPGLVLPSCAPGSTHVFHLYVVHAERRDELRAFLTARGIESAIHYPTSLPFLPPYAARGFRPEMFPNAFRNQSRILSLPIFPEMTDDMLRFVCDSIRAFYSA
ncbi:MAG TPA: DegT/DnrJ/EryC1/StrS family aminotransferase [Kofleriaceae bacterium]